MDDLTIRHDKWRLTWHVKAAFPYPTHKEADRALTLINAYSSEEQKQALREELSSMLEACDEFIANNSECFPKECRDKQKEARQLRYELKRLK